MFVTVPGFSFPVPTPLRLNDEAQYWRVISLEVYAAWYVATLDVDRDDDLVTLVFSWDTDLVQAIEDHAGAKVLSLLCMVFSRETGWTAIPVAEVWKAVDPEYDDQACILLVGRDGLQRAGHQGNPAPRLRRDKLVTRVE